MASKKARAHFTCPGWATVPGVQPAGDDKIVALIEAGKPVPRSSLRRALAAARTRSGSPFDIDAHITDTRTGPHSTAPRAQPTAD